MFEIEYYGGNALTITNKGTILALDPKRSVFGMKDLDTTGLVELGTEERFLNNSPKSKVVICSPGEYEVGDFSIKGIPAQRHLDTANSEKLSVIYGIEVNDIRIAVLGNIAPEVSDEQLEALGVVDILVVPIGGSGYTLDATSAVDIVRRIEPKMVIPVHYADDNLKYEVPQDDIQTFIREVNVQGESVNKLKVKTASNIPDSLTVYHLALSRG